MAKQAIDAKRGTIFLVEPENLTIITDPKHPLYDPRVELPVSDDMVNSILSKGVIEPVIARKNGDTIEVTDGRQRTRCAIEANKRLRAEGAPTIQVPVILRRESDAEAFETSVVLNEIRRNDDVLTKAAKAGRLSSFGQSDAQIAVAFGVTVVTVRNWLKLLDLAPVVQKAVKSGQLGAIEAVKALGGLTREAQKERLPAILETAPKRRKTDKGEAQGGGDEGGKGIVEESPMKRLRALYRSEAAMQALTNREVALMSWVYGKITQGDLLASIPRMGKFFGDETSAGESEEDEEGGTQFSDKLDAAIRAIYDVAPTGKWFPFTYENEGRFKIDLIGPQGAQGEYRPKPFWVGSHREGLERMLLEAQLKCDALNGASDAAETDLPS